MGVSLLVPNFRDVGETVNVLHGSPVLAERVLLRGGEMTFVEDLELIHSPRTIINLRKGEDPVYDRATTHHCPAPDSVDVYSAVSGFNRKWIVSVLKILASPESEAPFYVHCAAGKDRTGVIVAATLAAIEIDRRLVAEDYELSLGPLYPELIAGALDCFAEENYFRKIDTAFLKRRFLAG